MEGVIAPIPEDNDAETWQKNRLVTALWCGDQSRNGWIYADSVGWRKLGANTDVAFASMLNQSAAAKAAQRPVSFLETNGTVTELYVL